MKMKTISISGEMTIFFLFSNLCLLMVHHNFARSVDCEKTRGTFGREDKVNLSIYATKPRQSNNNPSLTPIILLHGLTSAKETWNYVIQELADATGRKVYSYDARNHGDSSWTDVFDSFVMTVDLSNLIKQLGISKVILIGHSMGGKISMYFALREPFKVEKLVVEDISPVLLTMQQDAWIYQYIRRMKEALKQLPTGIQNLKEAKNFVASYILQKESQGECSERHGYYDISVWPLKQTLDGKFQWKTNVDNLEFSALCGFDKAILNEGLYEGPVLFIYGSKSPLNILKDKDFILTRFPKAVFKGIQGATHQLHLEFKNEFLKALIPFLNEK